MTTLFDQLGGAAAVNLAVDKFYERVLQDDRIKHFFANVDMVKQRAHQKPFSPTPLAAPINTMAAICAKPTKN